MDRSFAPTDKAREEAAAWFARLKKQDVPIADLEDFRVWRQAPGHREAYDEVDAFWRRSQAVKDDSDIRAAVKDARMNAASHRRRRGAILGLGVAMAGAVVAGVAGVAGWRIAGPQHYETGIGEQRLVRLADGSTVKLDADSRIDVRMSDHLRDIRLNRGRALFDVAHNAQRPFTVVAGETSVTALGTRFDVSRTGEGARVNLIRGSVEVRLATPTAARAWRLSPGQAVSTTDPTPAPRAVDMAAATSWTTGRLIFQATPLEQAVTEVNRYNKVKIILEVGAVARTPVSGAFDAGDTEAFVNAMAELNELSVQRPSRDVIRLTLAEVGPNGR